MIHMFLQLLELRSLMSFSQSLQGNYFVKHAAGSVDASIIDRALNMTVALKALIE